LIAERDLTVTGNDDLRTERMVVEWISGCFTDVGRSTTSVTKKLRGALPEGGLNLYAGWPNYP
jgi:hypothetical protein